MAVVWESKDLVDYYRRDEHRKQMQMPRTQTLKGYKSKGKTIYAKFVSRLEWESTNQDNMDSKHRLWRIGLVDQQSHIMFKLLTEDPEEDSCDMDEIVAEEANSIIRSLLN